MISTLKRWGWLILIALGAVVAWVLRGIYLSKSQPKPLSDAIGAMKHQAAVEKAANEQGKEAALAEVNARFKTQREALDAKQQEEAKALEVDPVQLSWYLARAGMSKPVVSS